MVIGAQGIPGPPGLPGSGSASFNVTASATVSQYAAIAIVGGVTTLADSSNLAHVSKLCGLAASTALAGAELVVQFSSTIVNIGWNWQPGPIYLGPSGTISQTAPTVGFVQIIGIAINPTTILLQLQPPLVLAA